MIRKLFLALLILILLAAIVVRFGAPKYAEYRLEIFLRSADSASFEIKTLDLWAGTVDIRKVYIQDTASKLSSYPVFINVDRIALKNISLWQIYRNKILLADSAIVGIGLVSVGLEKKNPEHAAALTDRKSRPLPIWKFDIKNVLVDTLTADLYYQKNAPDERMRADLHFSCQDFYLDQFAKNSLKMESLEFWARNVYIQPKKSDTFISVQGITYSSKTQKLALNDLETEQRTAREVLAKKAGFDKLHSHVIIKKILLYGIHSDIYAHLNGLHIPKIEIEDVQAFLYKDKRFPHPDSLKLFGLQQVAKLKFKLEVDTIKLKNGNIIYEENWREDGQLAMLDIGNINATVYNLGNTSQEKKYTQIYGTLNLLNELPLKIDWRWDRSKGSKRFKLKIDIGQMPVTAFNSFSKNAFDVIFVKGQVLGGRMVVSANDVSATGTLHFNYSNLKLKILTNKKHDSNFGLWLGSTAVNFVVNNNNLANDKERVGTINMQRDITRSEFSYVAKIFVDGVKGIVVAPTIRESTKNFRQKRKDKKTAKNKK